MGKKREENVVKYNGYFKLLIWATVICFIFIVKRKGTK